MKKTNDYKPSKVLKVITEHKTIISILLLLLYVLTIGSIFLYNNNLEETYFISQIICGIFVVGGLVVSVLQYTASCVDNTVLRDQEKKIRAAEMANKFQAEMIPELNVLAGAYRCSKLDEKVLDKLKEKELKLFDKDEVDRILAEIRISQEQILSGLYAGCIIYDGKISIKNVKESGKVNISDEDKKMAEDKIWENINQLSNKLEYFGICFNSGIADEDTVYQSLHNVFFQCVYMLYPFIFANNTSESDRLFSNVSRLYIKWKERYENLVNEEKQELINRKMDVQQKIVVKAKSARY